jgi:hypothetical protein
MKIKDTIVSWYIRNVMMPKTEDIYNPGFIITKAGGESTPIYLREIALPESIMVELEKKIVEGYQDRGKQILYSAGKKFGYSYASLAKFNTTENSTEKEFLDFLYYLILYVSGSYGSNGDYDIDVKSKRFELEVENYVVCPKNGFGLVMADGSISGVISYLLCDPSIEGVQVECQGRGGKRCRVLCATPEEMSSKNISFFKEIDLNKIEYTPTYRDLNKIDKPHYAKSSLKNLIDTHFFLYSNNILTFQGERHFFCEFDILPVIEKEIQKLENGRDILFKCAFDYGKTIARKSKNMPEKLIMDYMSSTGWGDILVGKGSSGRYFVTVLSFPWSNSIEGTDYVVFRGIVSGVLSESIGSEIIFKTTNTSISQGKLNVRFEQG